ncbi:MAG: alpha/beta hydrolase [Cyanobacteria bacterium J06635_15]
MSPHYRFLVWDARGHGQSQPMGSSFSLDTYVQDMLAILDDMKVSQAVFCGQSLGGYIAQQIYFSAPERVQAIIIIGATPIAKAYSKFEIWVLKASLPLFRFWPYGHFTQAVARNTAQTQLVQDYALQAIRQVNREDFLSIWRAVTLAVDDQGQPELTIDVPLLLVHGDQDGVGSIKRDMPIWATQEKKATYHVIPNAGHNANQENPTFTNQVIVEFLARDR